MTVIVAHLPIVPATDFTPEQVHLSLGLGIQPWIPWVAPSNQASCHIGWLVCQVLADVAGMTQPISKLWLVWVTRGLVSHGSSFTSETST